MSAALQRPARALGAAEVLALTLWGEAGDRPVRAMEAVASVVMARVRLAARPGGPAHLGQGVAGVCRAPFQFACWHPGHPRHAALMELPAAAPDAACRVAARAIAGALPDPVAGATHYHDSAALPCWALGVAPTAEIGGLVFYRLLA
jgi:N-acetylmuramoyl-L-alanine amidase